MNKISTAILLFVVVIICATCIYEAICIRELRRDVTALSASIRGLKSDTKSLYADLQEMKHEIKSANKTIDLILGHLWLIRPHVPDDRFMPAKNSE